VDGRPVFAVGAGDAIDNINSRDHWASAAGALDLPTTYDATYGPSKGYPQERHDENRGSPFSS